MNRLNAILAVCYMVVFTACSSTAQAGGTDVRQITVTGDADVLVKPDEAVVRFSVQTKDEDLDDAVEQNDGRTARVLRAMKKLGVKWIISVSAVGSLKEEYAPTHIVLPNQFYDKTRFRVDTFFGEGIVAHIGFADPICQDLSDVLYNCGKEAGATVHLAPVSSSPFRCHLRSARFP